MAKAATKKATPKRKTVAASASAVPKRSLEAGSSGRRPWSAEDIRVLKAQAKQRVTAANIAKALGRSEGATRQKAFSVGVSLDSR